MIYEELYKKASMGDEIALEKLIDCAEQGEADAQYLLSCLYEIDERLKNEEQADYWLEMAAFNGNEKAKKKLHERPLRPIKNNRDDEDDDSEKLSEEATYYHMNSEEEKTRWRIRIIWWIVFPILLGIYYLHKCENDAKNDKAFQELITPFDQKSNINPSEHLQIDSNLNIKADKEYIEHLEKKFNR